MISSVKVLMRYYSYAFHALLALFLLGISALAMLSGNTLRLDVLPWEGNALTWWLFGSALVGLAAVALAVAGKLRAVFFVWSLVVLVMLVRGFFFSSHFFRTGGVSTALYLILGALLAAAGAWFQLASQPSRAKWQKARA